MPEADIKRPLDEIWSSFNRVGISDTLTIIEHVAALLTEGQAAPSEDIQPRLPPKRPGLNMDEIRNLLKEAADAAGDKATLFDRYVIFRLQERLRDRSGHYPTPRHIVQFMRNLVQIEENQRLADFACGTGGFLVTHEKGEKQARSVTGIDNAPEWARLAWANVMLHGDTTANIIVGDPLRICSAQGELHNQAFDRILMNPPFGGPIDVELGKALIGPEIAGDSATVLTTLALRMLAEDGQAAILVPSGTLFVKSAGEQGLRERLIGTRDQQGSLAGMYHLEAVISLPGDALQPYSSLQAHMLLVNKKNEHQHSQQIATWFFQPAYDGYPSGRKRDLTTPPTMPNDLTYVEKVLLTRGSHSEDEQTFATVGMALIGVKKIKSGETFLGVIIEALNGAAFRVAYYPKKEQASAFFLASAIDPGNSQRRVYVSVVLGQDLSTDTDDDDKKLLARLYPGVKEKDIPLPTILLAEDAYGEALAIAPGDQVLGVAIAAQGIIDREYGLQPKDYVKTPGAERIIEPPAVLLGRVHKTQYTFLAQIDGLLGRLELKPITGQQLPSPLRDEVKPLPGLSREQERIWDLICTISEQHQALNGLFTLEDVQLQETDSQEKREATRLTFDLFERMGVIVPVTIVDPNKHESLGTIFYKRVTERDIWEETEPDHEGEKPK